MWCCWWCFVWVDWGEGFNVWEEFGWWNVLGVIGDWVDWVGGMVVGVGIGNWV